MPSPVTELVELLALERLEGVVPPERTIIITAADLLEATAEVARHLPPEPVIDRRLPHLPHPCLHLAGATWFPEIRFSSRY